MRKTSLHRPVLEALEGRWTPATIRFTSGILQVSNQVGDLTITQTANNRFTVTDGAKTVGSFSGVGQLLITGTNLANKVTVSLATFNFGGSLVANTGNGNDTVTLQATGGRIGGNTTLVTGLGNDTVNVSRAAGALSFGGNLQVADQAGVDSALFGNATGSLRVGGNVSLTGINTVLINSDQPNTFSGSFSAVLGNDHSVNAFGYGLDFEQDAPAGAAQLLTIGKSLTLSGGNNDDFFLSGLMTVGGNLTVSYFGAVDAFGNAVNLSSSSSGITNVNGHFTYTGGFGDDNLDLARSVFDGNVVLNLGTGDDQVALDDGVVPSQTLINGNLVVFADGDLDMSPFGDITAAIAGDAQFFLGNGNSNIRFGATGTIGGRLVIRAGNGTNFLGLFGATTYNLNVLFGSGDDEIEVNNPGAIVFGYANADGGSNTLDLIAGTLSPNLILIGF